MLPSNRERLLDHLGADDVVLDVGGWADPFERADWVIDAMPYETRGLYERRGWVPRRSEPERFSELTWIQRDVCDRQPYPFSDKQIDFAICSQVLEDVRDPVWVCSELVRVAKAGYIEVPARLEDQSWGVNGAFVGWSHHRWLIDVDDGAIEFVSKLHALHAHPEWYFPEGFWGRLSDEERVQTLWWSGDFAFSERTIIDDADAAAYLGGFVSRELAHRPPKPGRLNRLRALSRGGRRRPMAR
jgi:hypothetical protein